ncbi:MAG: MSCRAMM family adhesin SdrC [Bacteroidales bacterium]|nr:MSCRAMM family adhesin SdrC [Bacteroidales bacterium]MCF8326840.1 MSCRAMM family adhesin SdrC [Bacteroidales bacterium]
MKNNLKYYLAGLLTGILIGIGLIFIFQSGEEKKSPQFVLRNEAKETPNYKKEQKPSKNQTEASIENKNTTDTVARQSTDSVTTNAAQNIDTSKTPSDTSQQPIEQDTVPTSKDSLPQDQNNDIVVMEDKLIDKQIVSINVTSPSDTNKARKNLDSLLVDDQTTKNSQLDSITIEYWKSPINYKGYRRIYNRLIVFGFTPQDTIEIFRRNKKLYMQIHDKNFPLNETNNFRSIWFSQ